MPVLVLAAVLGVLGYHLMSSGPEDVVNPSETSRNVGIDDGVVPDGTTVFDDSIPAVAKLDTDLLVAIRQASTDAGFAFGINSGWRSSAYQEQLLRDAIARYGSEAEAARWVSTPDASAHVTGDAVDVGSYEAADWLSQHGAAYGLCQTYANEAWHFELRPSARTQGCPRQLADATDEPRTRR